MRSVEAETDFLDQLYGAAIEPTLWNDALTRFTDILGASEAQLLIQDEAARKAKVLYVKADPAAAPLYTGHYVRCNPLLKTNDRPFALRVMTDEHKISKQEFTKTEFY